MARRVYGAINEVFLAALEIELPNRPGETRSMTYGPYQTRGAAKAQLKRESAYYQGVLVSSRVLIAETDWKEVAE